MRFQRFAAFAVADGGRTVKWHAPSTTRPDTLRHLLLDQVLPAMAFEHSLIGLHASAVVVGGAGIAFAGPTSRGKSTLAASFAADGHPVVTDDCLMLRWKSAEPCAVPSYPSLRLWKSTADRLFGLGGSLAPVARVHLEASNQRGRFGVRLSAASGARRQDLRDRSPRGPCPHRPVVGPRGLRRAVEDDISPRPAGSCRSASRGGGPRGDRARACRWLASACRCNWSRS